MVPLYKLPQTPSCRFLSLSFSCLPSTLARTASFKMSGYPSLFRESSSAEGRRILMILGSEEMSLVQLYIPSEVAHDTMSELAEMGNFQFKDVSCIP